MVPGPSSQVLTDSSRSLYSATAHLAPSRRPVLSIEAGMRRVLVQVNFSISECRFAPSSFASEQRPQSPPARTRVQCTPQLWLCPARGCVIFLATCSGRGQPKSLTPNDLSRFGRPAIRRGCFPQDELAARCLRRAVGPLSGAASCRHMAGAAQPVGWRIG